MLFDFLATFAEGASLSDHAGLELALEDLLGAHVDVISRGGLKPKHAGILAAAVTLWRPPRPARRGGLRRRWLRSPTVAVLAAA